MSIKQFLAAGFLILAALWSSSASSSVIEIVKKRGALNCGTDNTAPGFGYLNTKSGKLEGLDIDFCRAMAAAVLGDANKVNYVIVTDKSRFNVLQTGQVDVVFAHTTVKPVRESAVGIDFLPINFYDGTGVMLKTSLGVKNLSELDGATICTTQGSGTESTLSGLFKARNFKSAKALTFENLEKLFSALDAGRCNAILTDKSALAAWRGNAAKPADFVILPDALDKAPFAGFVVANDSKWRNTLRWATYALFQAEEWGITSQNLPQQLNSSDIFVQKFLGLNGGFGKDFGISDSFVADMVRAVGNYGEIYDRNLGPKTPFHIEREGTPNASWTKGGAVYSPTWN
ncbi:transporter substrate-binding domain-containing protein [Methylobacterium sp. WL64]|uniref:transporter substrate-binding domain-containing protein n=1 Tax=Methylobacterium sp. WL64 TaxID=2603894 RepID=UPI0011CCD98B|nr:transporter substrate-binding domain-containing protein [Methylobacterium sp. WL64]TXM96861.1 transporter substrate-binding domain-containing protein [Methylobacterium sp. WL64]